MVSLPKQLQVQCTQQRGRLGGLACPHGLWDRLAAVGRLLRPPHKESRKGDLHRSQLRVAALAVAPGSA